LFSIEKKNIRTRGEEKILREEQRAAAAAAAAATTTRFYQWNVVVVQANCTLKFA